MIGATQLAEALGVTREEARGLISFLRAKELLVRRGERPNVGRGRGEDVFDVPYGTAARLAGLIKPLEGK